MKLQKMGFLTFVPEKRSILRIGILPLPEKLELIKNSGIFWSLFDENARKILNQAININPFL
jgi:hypothetical protein